MKSDPAATVTKTPSSKDVAVTDANKERFGKCPTSPD